MEEMKIKSRVSWHVTPCNITSEDGHSTLLRKVCVFLPNYVTLNSRRLWIHFCYSRDYIVAYRHIARQRPRKKRVQPLLCNRRTSKRLFLSNSSINTFPRKQHKKQYSYNGKGAFSVVSTPRLYCENPSPTEEFSCGIFIRQERREGGKLLEAAAREWMLTRQAGKWHIGYCGDL
jgi:hypothetical protein